MKSMQEKTLSAALDLPRNTNLQTQRQSFHRKLNSMHVYLRPEETFMDIWHTYSSKIIELCHPSLVSSFLQSNFH